MFSPIPVSSGSGSFTWGQQPNYDAAIQAIKSQYGTLLGQASGDAWQAANRSVGSRGMSSTDPIAAKLQSELYAPQQQGLSASYYGALAQAEMAKQQQLQAQWQWEQQQQEKRRQEEEHNAAVRSGAINAGANLPWMAGSPANMAAMQANPMKPLPLAQMPMQWMTPAWPNNQSVVQGTMNPVSNYPGPSHSMLNYGMPQEQQQPWGTMAGASAGSGQHPQQQATKKPWTREQVDRNTWPMNPWR